MQDLLNVRDVVSIDSFEHLDHLVIVAGTVDEVLDVLVVELDIIDDRPVGVERSENTIITELDRAVNVGGERMDEIKDVGLDASISIAMKSDRRLIEVTTHRSLRFSSFPTFGQATGRDTSFIKALNRRVSDCSKGDVSRVLIFGRPGAAKATLIRTAPAVIRSRMSFMMR